MTKHEGFVGDHEVMLGVVRSWLKPSESSGVDPNRISGHRSRLLVNFDLFLF